MVAPMSWTTRPEWARERHSDRRGGGARELVGRWEVEWNVAASGAARSHRISEIDSTENLVGCGAHGGKAAAWQKAQVASS